MMNYNIISTGSSGNAVLVDGRILVDCGVSIKALSAFERDIKLVLLTHCHGDHFKKSTVKSLARNHPALRWGCCDWMAQHLVEAGVPPQRIDIFSTTDKDVEYMYPDLGVKVRPEKLTHNVPNCGYHIFSFSGADRTFYATDTGSLEGVKAEGYDLYLLEANHGEEEIQARIKEKQERGDSFIYETSAAINHLSYEKACAWLKDNMRPDSVWVRLHEHKEDKYALHV